MNLSGKVHGGGEGELSVDAKVQGGGKPFVQGFKEGDVNICGRSKVQGGEPFRRFVSLEALYQTYFLSILFQ